jgi:hypothetical protein
MKTKRWQDWLNVLLGAWLFISPWALNYASELPRAAWNAYILGGAVVLFAAAAVYLPKAWEEGLNILLGAWAVVSPWVLGFAASSNVTTNMVIVGGLIAVLAAWAMARDGQFQKWRRNGHPA